MSDRLTKAQRTAIGLFVLEHALNGKQHAALLGLADSFSEYRTGFLDGWASGFLAGTGEKPWSIAHQERALADFKRVEEKRR